MILHKTGYSFLFQFCEALFDPFSQPPIQSTNPWEHDSRNSVGMNLSVCLAKSGFVKQAHTPLLIPCLTLIWFWMIHPHSGLASADFCPSCPYLVSTVGFPLLPYLKCSGEKKLLFRWLCEVNFQYHLGWLMLWYSTVIGITRSCTSRQQSLQLLYWPTVVQ